MLYTQKTHRLKPQEKKLRWFVLDATGKTLGRFCAEIAKILIGKHTPLYGPDVDAGDGVIVTNAEKIIVTGNKKAQKLYRYYTGYMGGLREIPYETMKARNPGYIITHAVKGMMPKTRLARAQQKRLRVFKGAEHKLDAQSPIEVNI